MTVPLILASQSPRRKELLAVIGIPFSVIPASIDEIPMSGETPEDFVVRAAREKGIEVASRVSRSLVLSADTIVTIDGEILGKPADEDEAVRMLKKLSGRQHLVYTAVTLINQVKPEILAGMERTEVWFNALSESQIVEYIHRENVMDKAGAYAIQGFAAVHIPRISGDYFNVMGLPLSLVYSLICRTLS